MRSQPLTIALAPLVLGLSVTCGPRDDAPEEPPPPLKDRRALLARLGRPARLLVGHGNDLPGADKDYDFRQAGIYSLPVSLDLHYVYLSGVKGEGGWPDYEPNGAFVTHVATIAKERGVTPMFTLYQAAARGEQNFDVFVEDDFMTKYWAGVRLLFEKLAAFDAPALLHLEPDFWGYAQRESHDAAPSNVPVLVRAKVPECASLPDDVEGMARCTLRLARAIAPKVAVGLHASGFGARFGAPRRVARFLRAVGALEADFVAVDTLDRDAGCFEAGTDPECARSDGPLYWDETNRRSPSFAEHFEWVRTVHEWTGLPVLWFQTPLGVPSEQPGGAPKHYRDNRVRYFFLHPDELEEAGGFAVVFGVGADNQTDITTDGGQFARAVERYFASPLALVRE